MQWFQWFLPRKEENTPSDLRLKKNIVYITDKKWNNLHELNPVQYYYTHDIENKTLHFGFIAQEVEEFFPELVHDNSYGYKTVNVIELIPLLVGKMNKMQAEIDELKGKRTKEGKEGKKDKNA